MNCIIVRSLIELAKALEEKTEDTYLCAGGTDLVIQLRKKKKFHYNLIDLTHLPDMRGIEEDEDTLIIGGAVTMTELEQSPLIQKYVPALGKAASMVGSTQIRNRATLGGNVANASQSSDTTPVLLAYGAGGVVFNEKGLKRTVLVDELIEGLEKNNLDSKEVLLQFIVKKNSFISGFHKVGSRKAVTISKINGCIKAELFKGRMEHTVVYLGAIGPKALRALEIEKVLEGQQLDGIDEVLLKDAVYRQVEQSIPNRSSKHYKKSAAYGVIQQIIEDLRKV